MCNVITARLLCRCSCFSVGASVFFLIRHYDICLSATQTSHTVSDGACSSLTLLLPPLVFMFSSPAGSISLLILLGNLFHSRVSEMSSWLRKENERGTRYRESAESPLWQNNLYTLTSPFIYLKVSALTVLNRCACSDQFCLLDDCWVCGMLQMVTIRSLSFLIATPWCWMSLKRPIFFKSFMCRLVSTSVVIQWRIWCSYQTGGWPCVFVHSQSREQGG